MVASIPASNIVKIIPNVVGAGGNSLDLVGLFLTENTRVPVGAVLSFGSPDTVSSYFGPSSAEASLAATYFTAFDGATVTPGALLFSAYLAADAKAWIRGGSLTGMTLSQLQGLSGVLTLTIDGSAHTSGSINLSSATSFSNAASLIQTGIAVSGVTCTWDSIAQAFVITGATAGDAGSMSYATGTLSAPLKLTAATGAVLSQGADASTPADAMNGVIAETQDFFSFSTTFEPDTDDKVAFAAWANTAGNGGLGKRFEYVMWDTDSAPTTSNDTSSAGYLIRQAAYAGTVPIYAPVNQANAAAFGMSITAATNFGAVDGRTNAAFRSQAAMQTDVSNEAIAENLEENGYNFYGRYATAAQPFMFFYPGAITGSFLWIDSYANQVWLNNAFQLGLMNFLTSMRSVPYNAVGYASIEEALSGQINDGLSFGAIRAGVTLSSVQAAEVNAAAGLIVSDTIEQRGWYLQVLDPGADARAARGSPIINFWYTDGQSVQRITMNSVEVA